LNHNIAIDSEALAALCRKWRVKKLALFGSAIRDDFGPESDVDVAVSFDPSSHWSLGDVVDMQDELRSLFKRDVDITELEAIRNPISRKMIFGSLQFVYQE